MYQEKSILFNKIIGNKMKKIICLSVSLFAGSVNAALISGDTVQYSLDTNVLSGSAILVEGVDEDISNFHFDFDSQVTNDVFLWTSTPVDGFLAGSTGLTISSLDFLSGDFLVDFDLFSTLLTGFSYSILSNDSISFSWSNTGQVGPGTIIEGRFLTQSQVPGPASLALLGLGLAGIGFSRKKKTA